MSINLLEQVIPIDGMEPVGEIRLVPDPATFTVLPWLAGTASVLCDQLDHDRTDWGACPRSFLKRVIERAAGHGITVQATFENEYYLATRGRRPVRPRRRPGARTRLQRDRSRPPRRRHARDGRRPAGAGHAGRAGHQRVRPGPAGDLDPAHPRPGRRRQPDEVPRHRAGRRRRGTACSPRSRPSRSPTRSAAARTCTSASGTPTAAQPALRRRAAGRPLGAWAGTSSPASPSTCPR